MITELLQERAALYAAGTMTSREREQFELVLEFHGELRGFTAGLLETTAAVVQEFLPVQTPPQGLKSSIMEKIGGRSQHQADAHVGFVMTGLDGLVQWINPAFTGMCGYTLEELSGKKPGPMLQGEKTDPQTAERLRRSVHGRQSCRETLINYHKDGSPYWVEIDFTPITDEEGTPLFLVARERELHNPIP